MLLEYSYPSWATGWGFLIRGLVLSPTLEAGQAYIKGLAIEVLLPAF